jgi:uncharacterized damage-inducible protein DinB
MRRAMVTAMVALSSPALLAGQQPPPAVSVTAPLDSQYLAVMHALHGRFIALATAIPAERYTWRPAEQVRSISEVLMHVAGEWLVLCPRSVGGTPPTEYQTNTGAAMKALEQTTSKDSVMQQLERSWEHCRTTLAAMTPERLVPDSLPAHMGFPRVVLLVMIDQNQHLGQLIAYARSVGVAPPWSQ